MRRFCLAMGLAVLAACGGKIPRTHYYLLDVPAPAPRPRDPASYTLAVLPFKVPDQLEQDRIVYRPSAVELDFYEYHRWAQRPGPTLTAALASRLRSQNLFSGVSIYDGHSKADYLLRPRLERLEEVDASGSVTARVELAAEIVDAKTNRAVWSGSAAHSAPVTAGEVRAVVEEMSRGVDSCLGQIIAGVEGFAKALPPAPAPASAGSR